MEITTLIVLKQSRESKVLSSIFLFNNINIEKFEKSFILVIIVINY